MNKTKIMVINLGMVRAIINVDQTLYEAKSMYFSKTDTLQCVHISITFCYNKIGENYNSGVQVATHLRLKDVVHRPVHG